MPAAVNYVQTYYRYHSEKFIQKTTQFRSYEIDKIIKQPGANSFEIVVFIRVVHTMIHLNDKIRRQSLSHDLDLGKRSRHPAGDLATESCSSMKRKGSDYDGRFSTTLLNIQYLHPDSKSLIGSILQHRWCSV